MSVTRCSAFASIIGVASFLIASEARSQLPAFPGAEGFGKFATGGRGGTIYHVTNTNDDGSIGCFRSGATTPNCTIVFDIGGVIRINSVLQVAPNVTIAGQTAPGGGVTIYGNHISYTDANNSITRFIRYRMGVNGNGDDSVGISTGHDMIFDHCSVSWGQDEDFSINGNVTNITIQSTAIAQGLQTHSAGGLIQTDGGVSILRCFYIDNHTRNPKVKGVNEYVNNVIYNWEVDAYILGDSAGLSFANVIGNYFINGPGSTSTAFDRGNLNFHLYATNNWQDANLNGVLDGAILSTNQYDTNAWETTPFAYPFTNAIPPLTAVKLAISDVGASWQRDSVDERLLTELTSWGVLGETIASEYEAPMNGPGFVRGGTPYTDTDHDGMPDYWESGTGSDPAIGNYNDPSPSGSGYTRLEDYLNWLADPHGILMTNTSVEIDLRQFTRGFTNTSPVYSVANPTNGSVTINGYKARFVPTPGLVGRAGFEFTVVDADGSTIKRPMNLFFTPLAHSFKARWRGDGVTNNWDTVGDYNWFDGESLLFQFHDGNDAVFDDSGSFSPMVNLVGSLQPASVSVEAAGNYTFGGTGSLGGSMTLAKSGLGSLALATVNTFSGATTVSNGALFVNGQLTQSPVTVRNSGALGGSGSIALTPTLFSGAVLTPGAASGVAGTLTISNNFVETGGITNLFDLSDDPSGLTRTNDGIQVVGDLNLSGINFVRVNLLDGPLADGVYTLISYSGNLTGGVGNLVLVGANGVLTNLPGAIGLHVDNTRPPANLTWLGNAGNNTWDTGGNAAWMNGVTQDRFYFGDTVLFDDSGSTSPPVTISGIVYPTALKVDASVNYTFSGSGKITGTTGLTKTNSGTLTVLTTNDYTGVTTMDGGVLAVAQVANGGVASGLGAAGTNASNLILNGGALRYTGPTANIDRSTTLTPVGGTIDVSSVNTTLTLSNGLTGVGTLTKTGAGKLEVTVAGDYSGGTVVLGGTLRMQTDTALGSGSVTLNGTTNSATFQFGVNGATLNNTLNISGTNNVTINNGNNTITTLIGDGTLTLNTGTTFTFGGDMTGFTGTIVAGSLTNPRFNGSSGSPSAAIDLANTSAMLNVRNGGSTIQIGALSGGPNTQLRGASSIDGLTTYVIGGKNLNTTFAGKTFEVNTARAAAITKVGSGTFTLTGANTHTGGTIINAGTLFVNNTTGSGTGTNGVTVNNTGTLGGTGFIMGPVTVNSGGVLAPGSNTVATLTVRSNLTLNAGSILNFDVGTTGVSDRIAMTGAGALALGGTLNVVAAPGFGVGTNTIFTYGGALSGSLTIGTQPAGFACSILTNVAGQVRLAVAASPANPSFGNVFLSGGKIVFSGTGGVPNGTYYVLVSTNLALPTVSWTRVATNSFSATGAFVHTNAIDLNLAAQFFKIGLP